jgi:receptor protein-tyrosine kinase
MMKKRVNNDGDNVVSYSVKTQSDPKDGFDTSTLRKVLIDSAADENAVDHTGDLVAIERKLGDILVSEGKLSERDIESILELQDKENLFFGDAAQKLKLVTHDDIQRALAKQFDYPTVSPELGLFSDDLVAAYYPFGSQAETFRSIRSQLLVNWLNKGHKCLCVTSPGDTEGRSYIAANLAVVFAQLGKQTLLIDADLRNPRQHEIFGFSGRLGLSAMLSGRIRSEQLGFLPEIIPYFTRLSVLGAGGAAPNPAELLSGPRFHSVLEELKQYFDVIIIDSPSGKYKADVQTVAASAGSALIVLRRDNTKLEDARDLKERLKNAGVDIVGSALTVF